MSAPVAPLTEKQFQAHVLQLASLYGWLVFHPYDSRRSAAGFPDLTLVRGGKLLFVELKTDRGRSTPDQRLWLDALRATGADARLWRPKDFAEIEETLRPD